MAADKRRRAFISYSRTNKEFATKLTKGLRSAGYPVWFDLLDIPTGARWDDEVEKALRECSIFMVILTPASIASENVKDEIGYAIDRGKRILPVLLEDCDVPLRLRRFQYVDFTTKSFEEGFESAKELLGDLVDEVSVPLVTKSPAAETQKAEREAKAEAERVAAQEAEADRLWEIQKAERKAKEEADRLAIQKAESDDISRKEAERLAAQKAVEERSARGRVEAQPRPTNSRLMPIGIAGIVIIAIAVGGYAIIKSQSLSPTPTKAPVAIQDPTEGAATTPVEAAVIMMPTQTEDVTSTEVVTPTASAPESEITDDKGAVMVLVPAGDFIMGSSEGIANEKPVHSVYLDAYYIDKFEVTNALYGACVNAGFCDPPIKSDSFTRSSYYGDSQYDEYPVVYVNWNMAKTFCEWRGARLPTEAQWEKAARGTDARIYPWGKGVDCQKANYQTSGNGCVGGTSKVGSYTSSKSPYGAYDMAGNVAEWVNDWYSDSYYQTSLPSNPLGPDTAQARVLRGGSWTRDEYNIRTTLRQRFATDYYNFDIGFRCAGLVP